MLIDVKIKGDQRIKVTIAGCGGERRPVDTVA